MRNLENNIQDENGTIIKSVKVVSQLIDELGSSIQKCLEIDDADLNKRTKEILDLLQDFKIRMSNIKSKRNDGYNKTVRYYHFPKPTWFDKYCYHHYFKQPFSNILAEILSSWIFVTHIY
jgi:hypothetical protein